MNGRHNLCDDCRFRPRHVSRRYRQRPDNSLPVSDVVRNLGGRLSEPVYPHRTSSVISQPHAWANSRFSGGPSMTVPLRRSDKYADMAYCWHLFERAQGRSERYRLIRQRRLVPFTRLQPTMLVRNPDIADNRCIFGNGQGWSIQIKKVTP